MNTTTFITTNLNVIYKIHMFILIHQYDLQSFQSFYETINFILTLKK